MKTTALALLLLASGAAGVATEATPPSASAGYVPCKVQQKTHAEFPIRLLYQGVVRGESSVVLEIDTAGHISDQLVTQYTHREFADEMAHAIAGWGFEPGTVAGKPIVSILNVTFEYSVTGVLVYEKQLNQTNDSQLEQRFAYFAHGPESLDHKPVPVDLPPPIYPAAWIRAGRSGSVTVRFFIDETGRARVPEIINDGDNLLASAAAAAVKLWKFEPPTHHGQPVLAHAEQVFVFHPPLAKAD
jgi:TonB family protein